MQVKCFDWFDIFERAWKTGAQAFVALIPVQAVSNIEVDNLEQAGLAFVVAAVTVIWNAGWTGFKCLLRGSSEDM